MPQVVAIQLRGDKSHYVALRNAFQTPFLSIHKTGKYHKHSLNKNKISVYDTYLA